MATRLKKLALTYWALGNVGAAWSHLERAMAARDAHFRHMTAGDSGWTAALVDLAGAPARCLPRRMPGLRGLSVLPACCCAPGSSVYAVAIGLRYLDRSPASLAVSTGCGELLLMPMPTRMWRMRSLPCRLLAPWLRFS